MKRITSKLLVITVLSIFSVLSGRLAAQNVRGNPGYLCPVAVNTAI
jgi:hypothetical protein